MLEPLEHIKFIVNHAFVAFDVFLQNDFDSYLAGRPLCLSDDAICASTERPAKSILGPESKMNLCELAETTTGLNLRWRGGNGSYFLS